MEKLIKKWNGRSIQDDGAYVSKEFKSFYRECINAMKREFPDAEFLNVHAGHYDFSGFIHRDRKYIYFSYCVPRGGIRMDMGQPNVTRGILIRQAKNEKDYRGKWNHFTCFYLFKDDVEQLLRE